MHKLPTAERAFRARCIYGTKDGPYLEPNPRSEVH